MFLLRLQIVREEEDLPIHLHDLSFQGKEFLGLVSQQKETEDRQNITGEFPCRGIEKVHLKTKKVIIFYEKPHRVDEKTQRDELQKAFGHFGILSQGIKAFIVGFLEVFPTA
jgi:hypothetical protein